MDLTWGDNSSAETGYRVHAGARETNRALTIGSNVGSSGSVGTYAQAAPTLNGISNFTIEFSVKPDLARGQPQRLVLAL